MKTPALLIAGLFSFICSLQAQLCTGSLGDPVVSIGFGNGPGSGGPLPANTTTYNHVYGSCPNDGEYSLVDISFGCFNGSWHTLTGDHTPNDAIGHYMLINASFTPGDFYVDTIRGLCANTNYEFATWVKNVLKPSACNGVGIKPNLTFKVETVTGTVLSTFNSGDIDAQEIAVWKQYGAYFQTPVGITDVVIRLTNNAPGGCGNDLALDDITFRPCGPKINASVANINSSDIFACESDRKVFLLSATFSAGIYANPSFQWQSSIDNGISWANIPGETNITYLRAASTVGQFMYRMLIADGPNINSVSCRLATNTITITVSQPDAQVTNYVFGCYGSDIAFYAAGGSKYTWTGPNGFTSNVQGPVVPNVQFTHSGWYKVTVTDFRGCTDSDSTNLVVYPAATAVTGPDVTICEGSSTTLTASGGIKYYWAPGNSLSVDSIQSPIASPTDSTIYSLVVFNQYGCYDTATMRVNVWKKPKANAGPDKKTRQGFPVAITGSITAGTDVNYYWTPQNDVTNPSALITKVNPSQSTTYTLHAESSHGCGVHTDQMFVKVYDKVLVPNAFSPNGDGTNDTWIIEPLEFFVESVTSVYNRYGTMVYSSKGYAKPWDGTHNGTPLPVGAYYYVIDLKTNKEPLLTGSVLIIR